ncbi:MAG: sodium:dicarboxylate symporter [candidate division Zixibacteria bacterium HGW-Zixibacteria-1]|nr:MAG: sodium:dicarboxylate symporter [candidate division Zixibacteria bacterium HGW-Zixibacteria-1]
MTEIEKVVHQFEFKQKIGLYLGPALALIILIFFDLDPANPLVTRTAAIAILMAVWWITEAIPIAATALIPVVLFPLFGVMSGKDVAPIYFNNVIFLFIGGFIIALAMQKWNLHRRIALKIMLLIGVSPKKMLLGFMVATAFLSMWISNTATTMMMIPIVLAVIDKLEDNFGAESIRKFAVGLLIGIAYAASIGGIATLIGTPPNLAFIRIFKIYFPESPEISFASWIMFGLPFSIVFLLIAWQLLVWFFVPRKREFKGDAQIFKEEYRSLGKTKFEEKVVLVVFAAVALLWIFRQNISIGNVTIPGWSNLFPENSFIDDGTVAMTMALLFFLIPSRSKGKGPLMDWHTAVKLPWGIVILFGGGFALAAGFEHSGLSTWLGGNLAAFSQFSPLLIIITVCLMMTFLTELTSNTATTQMILPILASLSVAIKINPLMLMIPATLSASCAFMLPVATPPNAIIFGSGRVTVHQLARTGILLNLAGVVIITLAIYLLGGYVFDIDPGQFPNWAFLQ